VFVACSRCGRCLGCDGCVPMESADWLSMTSQIVSFLAAPDKIFQVIRRQTSIVLFKIRVKQNEIYETTQSNLNIYR
jgi:hypothetical protein